MIADPRSPIKRSPIRRSCDHAPATTAAASGPVLLQRARGGGGRNARATSSRSRASGMSPGGSLKNRRSSLAQPRSFSKLRNAHVFRCAQLSGRFLPLAIEKNPTLVQKLWRMRLPCGRARKTKNKSCWEPIGTSGRSGSQKSDCRIGGASRTTPFCFLDSYFRLTSAFLLLTFSSLHRCASRDTRRSVPDSA